jgi:hypothetical protein
MDQLQEATGSPLGNRRRRRGAGIAVGVFAAGLVIGIMLAGLNVAGAQSSSPSQTPNSGTRRPGLGFGPGGFGHFWFGFGALHGEFTIPAPGGGYQTLAVQTGQVTSVSASSIAVKSEDGFVRTYSVDDSTLVTAGNNGISDVKTGDTVRVVAVVSGGKARAVDIVDATTVQQSRGRWAPFPGDWRRSP